MNDDVKLMFVKPIAKIRTINNNNYWLTTIPNKESLQLKVVWIVGIPIFLSENRLHKQFTLGESTRIFTLAYYEEPRLVAIKGNFTLEYLPNMDTVLVQMPKNDSSYVEASIEQLWSWYKKYQ